MGRGENEMKKYKKPRRRTSASRKRQVLSQMAAANQHEQRAVTMSSVEKRLRAQIQNRLPNETAEEIERRVAISMKGGAKPTTAKVPKPEIVSGGSRAARKAERRRQFNAIRQRRR